MSVHPEEFEVGGAIDQSVRTAITGAAQIVESLARSSAASDRAAAQALREQLLVRPTDQTVGPTARTYLFGAEGQGAARVADAWASAVRGAAEGGPLAGESAEAARQLGEHARVRYGADVTQGLGAALGDVVAAADDRSVTRAAAVAAREETARMFVLPAHNDNQDRGVSPTKAGSPAETVHRQQTWDLARRDWAVGREDLTTPQARRAAWNALPIEAKTDLYWRHYDTVPARTVNLDALPAATAAAAGPERGLSPSKASTEAERLHRQQAWTMAQAEFAATMPAGTTRAQAASAWHHLDWQDKALRYWQAYDNPATQPTAPAALTRERAVELNGVAADFFAREMPGKGQAYFEQRLGGEAVTGLQDQGWRLGYAPASWTQLTDHLRAYGATDHEIVEAGLGRMSSRGNVIDAFRDRAMVAVQDGHGSVVGFVGRDLSGSEAAPRYVNTTGTVAFTKGDHLLGLHEAAEGARIYRVEGPFDALAISAAGEGRAAGVAPLGTALTGTQADLLAERGKVYLALDGDTGGQRAAVDDFWRLSERGVDVRSATMPEGWDPAAIWESDPDFLRAVTSREHDLAGFTVVADVVDRHAQGLANGEHDAYLELSHIEDQVASTMGPADQERLRDLISHTVSDLHERADEARVRSGQMDVADDRLQGVADNLTDRIDRVNDRSDSAEPLTSAQERFDGGSARAHRGSDAAAAAAASLEGAAGRAGAYDRAPASVTTLRDSEAVHARVVSAPASAMSTRDVLGAAQNQGPRPIVDAGPARTPTIGVGPRRRR